MPITARKLADGTTVCDVREDTGFIHDEKIVTCRTKAETKAARARMISERDAMRN